MKEFGGLYVAGVHRPLISRRGDVEVYETGPNEISMRYYWLRWLDYLLNRV